MTPDPSAKLPLWRLIAGIVVLGSLLAIVGFLTPVYLDDFRLHRYILSLAKSAAPDEILRSEVIARAHELNLPVRVGDVHVAHPDGKTKIELRYTVKMDIALYPVDLHFPTIR